MKKLFLFSLMMCALPLSMVAQDDMYFVPSKSAKTSKPSAETRPDRNRPTYYRGRDISLDDYNRRNLKSSFETVGTDSVGNDIIEFTAGDGTYPQTDTVYIEKYLDDDNDFRFSTRLGRFDGFYGWYDPFFRGYWGWGRYPFRYYGWYDPWYDPWYYGWYDPWYYGWYDWSWYSPWYYSFWYSPWHYYGGGGGYVYHENKTPSTHSRGLTASTGRGYTSASRGSFGGRVLGNNSTMVTPNRSTYASSGGRVGFGGNRSTVGSSSSRSRSASSTFRTSSGSTYSGSSRGSYSSSSSSRGSYSSGGSFGGGGSRSGGGFSGGGSTGGGSRSGGGGGGFGGRR